MSGVPTQVTSGTPAQPCDQCAVNKLVRAPIPHSSTVRELPALYRLHMDTVTAGNTSKDGKRGFLLITDEYSEYRYVYCYRRKSEVPHRVTAFITRIQRISDKKVIAVRCDNGTEFVNQHVLGYCEEHGITVERSSVGFPQENGLAERSNRTVLDTARTMVNAAKLSKGYWSYSVRCAVFTLNRIQSLKCGVTPYECLFGRQPDVSVLRVFGARGWALSEGVDRPKFAQRGEEVRFLGYSDHSPEYIVEYTRSGRMGLERSLVLRESRLLDVQTPVSVKPVDSVITSLTPAQEFNQLVDELKQDEAQAIEKTRVRRSTRQTKAPERYGARSAKVAQLQLIPKSYMDIEKVGNKKEWYDAYQAEVTSMQDVGCMRVVEKPAHVKPIQLLELFVKKYDNVLNREKFKVRFVARGDTVHTTEQTYAPVANLAVIRLLLSLKAMYRWNMVQVDVSTAFLHAELKQAKFYQVPKGHVDAGKNKVWKSARAIYGLKESPLAWNKCIHAVFMNMGFTQCPVEQALYYNNKKVKCVYVLLYVDDMLILGDRAGIEDTVKTLGTHFKIKQTEKVTKFVGIELELSEDGGVTLHNKQYINKIARVFGVIDSKPVYIPMQAGTEQMNGDTVLADPRLYQAVVGSLLYANMTTRPDLAVSVNLLTQHGRKPTPELLRKAKRVLKYLYTASSFGLKYRSLSPNEPVRLCVHSDSSFANGVDRRSMCGFTVKLNDNLVTWKTKCQRGVATSTCEAELVGMAYAVATTKWLHNILKYMCVPVSGVDVHGDNQGMIKLLNGNSNPQRTKHVDVKYMFTRTVLQCPGWTLHYVATAENEADALTKLLDRVKLNRVRAALMVGC